MRRDLALEIDKLVQAARELDARCAAMAQAQNATETPKQGAGEGSPSAGGCPRRRPPAPVEDLGATLKQLEKEQETAKHKADEEADRVEALRTQAEEVCAQKRASQWFGGGREAGRGGGRVGAQQS